jgi:adenosine deaminase
MARPLESLPKAHLHLHFTGSMRVETLRDLADKHGLRLPDALLAAWPPRLSARDERGWFRFQRLYDAARACVRDEDDLRRIVREAAEDDTREGSPWWLRRAGSGTRSTRGPSPGSPPSTPARAPAPWSASA